ncbi:hypothetical protein ACWGHD_19175 [Streptomyces xanthophaeus]
MTNPELKCMIYDTDRIKARQDPTMGGRLVFECYGDHGLEVEVYAKPEAARTFARSILALADAVDSGKAIDDRPRVGDRLRVTEDNPRCCPVLTGALITVVETDYSGDGEDCVRFLMPGDDYRWFMPLSAVERVDETAPAREPIQVGDRVRVVKDDPDVRPGEFVGLTGEVIAKSGSTTPYKVKFGPGMHGMAAGYWYCAEVERIDEPQADSTSVDLSADADAAPLHRESFVTRAKELLSGTAHTGADVIAMAAFLADA